MARLRPIKVQVLDLIEIFFIIYKSNPWELRISSKWCSLLTMEKKINESKARLAETFKPIRTSAIAY